MRGNLIRLSEEDFRGVAGATLDQLAESERLEKTQAICSCQQEGGTTTCGVFRVSGIDGEPLWVAGIRLKTGELLQFDGSTTFLFYRGNAQPWQVKLRAHDDMLAQTWPEWRFNQGLDGGYRDRYAHSGETPYGAWWDAPTVGPFGHGEGQYSRSEFDPGRVPPHLRDGWNMGSEEMERLIDELLESLLQRRRQRTVIITTIIIIK